jgi:hypothetical protein
MKDGFPMTNVGNNDWKGYSLTLHGFIWAQILRKASG